MEQMCRGALDNGIELVGFTEHLDLLPADPCYDYLNVSGWWEELQRCRKLFAGQLTILAGIELGEPHRFPGRMQQLLSDYRWDYALGSLHWVGDELIFGMEYFQRPPDRAYGEYFAELHRMATNADFDILAHLDVVKRFGFEAYGEYQVERYEGQIREVLRTIAERGLALEINTSQLRRPIGESAPTRPVIDWFREEGGQHVTLGSDAHQPDHIGYGLRSVAADLVAAGFPGAAWYQNRQARLAGG